MSGFNNPIIGGGGGLVYPSIHSPNFVTGSAGWTIRKDGSAEFNNVVIRNGQVVAGTAIYYSPTPGAGNMVASVAAAAGTDPFGNAYMAGMVNYTTGANPIAIQLFNGTVIFNSATTQAGPWGKLAQISAVAGSGNMGLNSVAGSILLQSPAVAQQPVQLSNIAAPAALAGGPELYGASGQPAYVNPAGLQANLSGAQLADTSTKTVTQAAFTDITAGWTIPANDMEVGAVYELTTGGNGTWGSTQQVLNFQGVLGATTFLSPQFGANLFAINTAFRWKVITTLLITATGSGGTFTAEMTANAAINNTTWLDGTQANANACGTVSGTGSAVNTTIANILKLQASWASTTGAPTISSHYSIFKRIA